MLIQTELRFERRGNVGLQGQNSEVFFAFDPQLNSQLVVKQVPKTALPDASEYFREASLLYDTRHPNIVDVKYACSDADHIYLAMPQYAASLHALLSQRALTVREIVKIGLDFLTGLHHVHTKNLVHFDVKPSNVLLDTSGRAALADFGLSRAVDVHGLATPAALYAKHVPPEYINSSPSLSIAADVYQAGLTLYRMCVGLSHFEAQLHGVASALGGAWQAAIAAGLFPKRNTFPAHVPNRLRTLIVKAISVDPGTRQATALELANDLALVTENLDWVFESHGPSAFRWQANDGTYLRTIVDEPDGKLRRVLVSRMNLASGKVTALHASGGVGLTPAQATATVQAALS